MNDLFFQVYLVVMDVMEQKYVLIKNLLFNFILFLNISLGRTGSIGI
jgi:hypothetical protein